MAIQGEKRITTLLDKVGWSGLRLSREVDVAPSTAYNWVHGRTEVPGAVVRFLQLILQVRSIVGQLGDLDGRGKQSD